MLSNSLRGGRGEVGVGLCSQVNSDGMETASSCIRLDIRERFSSERAVRHCTTAQVGGGVTIPEGVQEVWRCGTDGHGLE